GVYYRKGYKSRPYQAQITHKGQRYYLGMFATPEEAHEARNKKYKEIHGTEFDLSYTYAPDKPVNGSDTTTNNGSEITTSTPKVRDDQVLEYIRENFAYDPDKGELLKFCKSREDYYKHE